MELQLLDEDVGTVVLETRSHWQLQCYWSVTDNHGRSPVFLAYDA
jgi:hypothetical protein